MYLSIIQLAQHRGSVRIQRERAGLNYPDRRTGTYSYDVVRTRSDGSHSYGGTIDYIEGEDVRDTKSRAIAAVRMLGYWPALRAEIATERLLGRGYVTMPRAVDTLDAFGQVTESGLILPGAP